MVYSSKQDIRAVTLQPVRNQRTQARTCVDMCLFISAYGIQETEPAYGLDVHRDRTTMIRVTCCMASSSRCC